MALTKRQKEILDFLQAFLDEYGYSPSFDEIARNFGYSSLATVHEHLENLREKGYIRKGYNESRSIELAPAEERPAAVELPLLGSVAAGLPIEAVQERETVTVPETMLAGGGENYVLRVKGQSMVEEHIRDGDFIIVSSRQTALNGEMVVALVNGDSATVKKFYLEPDGRVRLQPANQTMQAMYYPARDVQIQGVVVGLIRRYG